MYILFQILLHVLAKPRGIRMLRIGNSVFYINRSLALPKKNINNYPKFEFHIAKDIRKKYEVGEELFSITGNVIFANNNAVRIFVQSLNSKRDISGHVWIGEVNAVGLLDEIYHFVLREYEEHKNPGVFNRALEYLNTNLGEDEINKILFEFVEIFPPHEVYKGKSGAYDYLNSYSGNKSNREVVLEEIMLLYFANFNRAAVKLKELFDDNYFSQKKVYQNLLANLEQFFKNEKTFGPDNEDVFTFLKTPLIKKPENLYEQLEFVREKWKIILTEKFTNRLLTSKDLMAEDIKFESFGGGGDFGGPPTAVPKYKGAVDNAGDFVIGKSMYKYALDVHLEYAEPEQFTADIDWMPRVVLMAKNVYVWLDQLSKKYRSHIFRLDQIPDEELDRLANWNFNGLWLIGIWERSGASKKIKHIMGNVDAVASAYSLFDYQIAHDLGGDEAYQNLNARAKARGIRLASDMVPNHTGIYSDWMINHPEYFIQSDFPPFPNYRFSGHNLSGDPNIQIRIEDGYWSHKDAAVVFQRIDIRTGSIKYIYHGNDGTNMPWNDTAQLNMIKKEVREAVIQKIFDVARKFSIIRFDAAMTLTKKHFSRLWYPQPGLGGDIPSRSDYAMTRAQFDEFFPEEFWREVVDRMNKEMPETLLLAEAFWLMEGYFVRTLGMHRVYNSAFMHMMMKEENAKYRDLITNTLEFEPEILKRYVNFMSNPDEETAIHQFGTDNKYFGVAALMVTLPGLPMFGHGQIEGFIEKYGMEYQRAYYNEEPKQWLIERHEREIFPLMRKRYLFSQVTNFWFYDFKSEWGNINENVFAYTNSEYGEKVLVFYNNRYESAKGKIYHSTPKLVSKENEERKLQTKSLADALGIKNDKRFFYVFREHVSGFEFIKNGKDFFEKGFELELGGFEYKVYFNFFEVFDETGDYSNLEKYLKGGGVKEINTTLKEIKLQPVHNSFNEIFNSLIIDKIIDENIFAEEEINYPETKQIKHNFEALLKTAKEHFNIEIENDNTSEDFAKKITKVFEVNEFLVKEFPSLKNVKNAHLKNHFLLTADNNYKENFTFFLIYKTVANLNRAFYNPVEPKEKTLLEKLLIDKPVTKILQRHGKGEESRFGKLTLINILLKYENLLNELIESAEFINDKKQNDPPLKNTGKLIELLENNFVQAYIGVNLYENILYFSKENFEELIDWFFTFAVINLNSIYSTGKVDNGFYKKVNLLLEEADYIKLQSVNSGYQLNVLKDKLKYGSTDKPETSVHDVENKIKMPTTVNNTVKE